jgi:hypothetical protein
MVESEDLKRNIEDAINEVDSRIAFIERELTILGIKKQAVISIAKNGNDISAASQAYDLMAVIPLTGGSIVDDNNRRTLCELYYHSQPK